MPDDFEWQDDYSIGVEEIDVQHKRFLSLIRATYALGNKRIFDKEVADLLDELLRYAVYHFGSEELLMKTYSYPRYLEQKREHEKLIADLEAKVEAIRANYSDLVPLLGSLVKWFVGHDIRYDKALGVHLNRLRSVK